MLVGLFGMALERLGCIATENSLRQKVELVLTDVAVQPAKDLVWVNFKLRNRSKWAVSVAVQCDILRSTSDRAAAQNSLEIRNIAPYAESAQRIGFDMEELRREGISDSADKDRCRVALTLKWICEAGDEQSRGLTSR